MSSNSRQQIDRARCITAVIHDYLVRRSADQPASPESLVLLHSELMPELGEELHKLRVIESSARRAGATPRNGSDITLAPADTATDFALDDDTQREFGDYELLEEIGRGGMGVLYRAWQKSLQRVVALKAILAGQMAAQEDVERFHAEATMAASLDHPGIVPVYEVGKHRRQHYYTMALVDGPNLSALVGDHPLAEVRAGRYVQQIAEAVHYAHRQGVVHRDLKPSNVLVDADDHVRITDFGLAKWIDTGSQLTATGRILGTPSYMPPEQAVGNQNSIGPASDIYSLGAILYELLVGRPPFMAENSLATLKHVVESDPVAPRLLNASISRDLETICLKCLEKDPARRYASAQELADDLARFLKGRPIAARPIGKAARAWRWCKRNPSIAALSVSVALALLAGATVSTYFAIEAQGRAKENELAWQAADQERQRVLEHQTTNSGLLSEAQAWRGVRMLMEEDNPCGLLHILAARQTAAQLPAARHLRASLWMAAYREVADGLVHVVGHDGPVVDVAVSPDGNLFATASEDGAARIWDAATGSPRCPPLEHGGKVNMVAFSPDGELLATVSQDQTARLWATATGRAHGRPMRHEGDVRAVAFAPDGKLLATGSDDFTLRIWDTTTTQVVCPALRHPSAVTTVLFSPSGRLLASLVQGSTLQCWKVGDWSPAFPPLEFRLGQRGRLVSPHGLVFSSDEALLATVSGPSRDESHLRRGVQLIDTQTGRPSGPQLDHDSGVRALVFTRDNKTLATACTDGKIHLWSMLTGKEFAVIDAHMGRAWSMAFSPNGETLATGSWDGTVKLWPVKANREWKPKRTFCHFGRVWKVAFSPDGSRLVSASDDGSARVWNLLGPPRPYSRLSHCGQVNAADISRDGKLVITASEDHTAQLWDATTGQPIGDLLRHNAPVQSALFSPDGTQFATMCDGWFYGGRVQFWRADIRQRQGGELAHDGIVASAFSGNGQLLATASDQGTIRLWDVATGHLQCELAERGESTNALAFSADSNLLASGSDDDTARIWNCQTHRPWRDPLLHENNVRTVAFSPKGDVLASGGFDSTVRVWSISTGAAVCPPLQHFRGVSEVAFSPDGALLASASEDRNVRLWDTASWKPHGAPLAHEHPVFRLAFSPDGELIATGTSGGLVTLWQTSTGMPLAKFLHGYSLRSRRLAFSADGKLLVSVGHDESALLYRLWTVPATLREIELRTCVALGARENDQGVAEPIPWTQWRRLRDELESETPPPDTRVEVKNR
jgi:WD40 repeat protein/serine/threonine protein kinase